MTWSSSCGCATASSCSTSGASSRREPPSRSSRTPRCRRPTSARPRRCRHDGTGARAARRACRLRPDRGAARRHLQRARRLRLCTARAERRWQVDHAAGHRRTHQANQRLRSCHRHARQRRPAGRADPRRRHAHPGGPGHLPEPHRRGEPADVDVRRRTLHRRRAGPRVHPLPAAEGTTAPARRHDERRRAADAGDVPRTRLRPRGAAPRRDLDGPRADHRGRALRPRSPAGRGGHHHLARGAVRQHRTGSGRLRRCDDTRPHRRCRPAAGHRGACLCCVPGRRRMIGVRRARHRAGSRRGRRVSVALVVTGLGSIATGSTGLLSAQAAAAPGSNFGSIDIGASAYGLRLPFYSHSGEDVESELPYSLSQLNYAGHALTSVMWPGDTGGHGGDTLKLLTGSCIPPNPFNTVPVPVPVPIPDLPCPATIPALPNDVYEQMNDPYKAEVQSGTGDPVDEQTNPGVSMKAAATSSLVRATTVMAGATTPGIGDQLGTSLTDTVIKLTGPNTAVVDAISVMRNVSLGGGAVTIQSIESKAHAVTTGKTATGTASTTVNGMKIGGVPVTVDDKGVHIQGQGQSLPSLDALNSMLKRAGFQLVVADPTKVIKGASAQLFSGQLIFTQDNPQYASSLNDSKTVVTLGGASIRADSSLAYVYNAGPLPLPAANVPPPVSTGGNVPPVSTGGNLGPTGHVPPPPVAAPAGRAGRHRAGGGRRPAAAGRHAGRRPAAARSAAQRAARRHLPRLGRRGP